jgi:thiamine biosynthesis lipoprotein
MLSSLDNESKPFIFAEIRRRCSFAVLRVRSSWENAGIVLVFLFSVWIGVVGCSREAEIRWSGKTMGTTYHITVVAGSRIKESDLRDAAEAELEAVNRSMSVHLPDSEISRFNSLNSVEESFAVSERFQNVLEVSRNLFDGTGGAWDGTVLPLVRLWGFNTREQTPIPSPEDIDRLLPHIGFSHIQFVEPGHIRKDLASLNLDLSSVAKGYGVDRVASVLRSWGIRRFLVEIGGEVFASGEKSPGKPWRVGINTPERNAPVDQVATVVELRDKALATSGDYRNYREVDGRFFSHILDPRTGRPTSNGVISVSVLADSCALADGLATALMVMGPEKGLKLVGSLNGVECLILVRGRNGTIVTHASGGFKTVP